IGGSPESIVAGDFDGDGYLDLALSALETVPVLRGNGDGTFQPARIYRVPYITNQVISGDFDRDGRLDLAMAYRLSGLALASQYPDQVYVLPGNGDGTFRTQQQLAGGVSSFAPVVGDFNRDGRLDLTVVNGSSNELSVLLGNGDGSFQPEVRYAVGSGPQFI